MGDAITTDDPGARFDVRITYREKPPEVFEDVPADRARELELSFETDPDVMTTEVKQR